MAQVLVVEDDLEMADEIRCELQAHGHQVDVAQDGAAGLALALTGRFDAITLDRGLPVLDGLALVDAVRKAGILTPVLMVSAFSAVDERIRGLRAGGDDYLVKPFDLAELAARVEVLLRRSQNRAAVVNLQFADLELDLISRSVRRAGTELVLMSKEFQLLEYLVRNSRQVLTKRMILEAVWHFNFDPATNLIEVHVARLRKKIDLPGLPPLIHTVRGAGYMLSDTP
ncbi:MAG: response regulator transcription factor [Burkholderiaceae bacterium]|nr:response regulator transcription factor [Roseateles sp.]MBV8469266.1 response regulator transcription factor [Burkholderiaceae bacterium]